MNRAMNKLHEALVDDGINPRFIETLPRRGYRFLAPAEITSGREVDREESITPGRNRLLSIQPDLPHDVEASVPAATVSRQQFLS